MTPLRASIGLLGARLRPGAGGFFAWWGHALGAWLPRRWRDALGLDRGRLLLAPEPVANDPAEDGAVSDVAERGMQLRWQDGDGVRDLGRLTLLPATDETAAGEALAAVVPSQTVDLPRWLLLPEASGLRRRLTLPATAGERLREVLGFEIDRQTPFAADAVAYDGRVLGRRGDNQVEVELVVVPKQVLQAQRAVLGPLAETLAGIDLIGTDGAPLAVNLLPPAQRRRTADPMRAWNLALAAIAVLTLAAGLWQLLDNRRQAADDFAEALEPKAAKAHQVAAQRQRLIDSVKGQAFLDRARSHRPTTTEVLDELSRRLPDDTYLEKLAIEDDRLLLIGLSAEASALLRQLEDSELWRAPALTGTVQPDPRSGRDRFTLVAELATAAATGPSPVDTRRPADGTAE